MKTPVRYAIFPKRPEAHLFEVRCTVGDPDPQGQVFALPAWAPGSYMIRDFARHVVSIRAESRRRPVALEKTDKHTWRAAPAAAPLTVIAEVYAWDLSVRAAHLDEWHGFFNGPCVFLRVAGHEERACELEILPPRASEKSRGGSERPNYRNWRVATAMTRAGAKPFGFGGYVAADYDELIDHPVEMGEFALAEFRACGVAHRVAISGRQRTDLARLREDLKRLCEQQIRFFGSEPPFDHYLFLVTAVGEGYGGLEHRASSALLCSRNDLPPPGMEETSEGYRTFLGLASHEYFHTWNVKRIKPAVFSPYDLGRENYTTLLWAFEGLTSYYDDLLLQRCGLLSREQYLELLGRNITSYLRTPGRRRQSVAESSFDAWTRYYRPDENSPNAIVSYYLKGSLIGLCLDLLIRSKSRARLSLDDVMRALWREHGLRGIGVGERDVERIAERVSGLNLRRFFERALRSTEELPLKRLLATHGVDMALRPAESASDKGGKPAAKPREAFAPRPALGLSTRAEGKDLAVTHVLDGGAAQAAGMSAGDVIVAIDGIRPGTGGIDALLDKRRVGELVAIHAFRRDELRRFDVRLLRSPGDTCALSASRHTALLDKWLSRPHRAEV
ncbi:MAG: M61 family metallopeptidase [Betaproteobacteria bacterium]|nr:M61 family metallopeptidase [Betaproteobacteria bacterium]